MKLSEMIAELEKLKLEHGDSEVYSSCHKNNMFYIPFPSWKSIESYTCENINAVIFSPINYGVIAGTYDENI